MTLNFSSFKPELSPCLGLHSDGDQIQGFVRVTFTWGEGFGFVSCCQVTAISIFHLKERGRGSLGLLPNPGDESAQSVPTLSSHLAQGQQRGYSPEGELQDHEGGDPGPYHGQEQSQTSQMHHLQ